MNDYDESDQAGMIAGIDLVKSGFCTQEELQANTDALKNAEFSILMPGGEVDLEKAREFYRDGDSEGWNSYRAQTSGEVIKDAVSKEGMPERFKELFPETAHFDTEKHSQFLGLSNLRMLVPLNYGSWNECGIGEDGKPFTIFHPGLVNVILPANPPDGDRVTITGENGIVVIPPSKPAK